MLTLKWRGQKMVFCPCWVFWTHVWGVKTILKRPNFVIFSFSCQSQAKNLTNKSIPVSIGVKMAELRGLRYSNYQFWPKKTPLKSGVRNCVELSASPILKRPSRGSFEASFSSGSHSLQYETFHQVFPQNPMVLYRVHVQWPLGHCILLYVNMNMHFSVKKMRPRAKTCYKWSSRGPLQNMWSWKFNSVPDCTFQGGLFWPKLINWKSQVSQLHHLNPIDMEIDLLGRLWG